MKIVIDGVLRTVERSNLLDVFYIHETHETVRLKKLNTHDAYVVEKILHAPEKEEVVVVSNTATKTANVVTPTVTVANTFSSNTDSSVEE